MEIWIVRRIERNTQTNRIMFSGPAGVFSSEFAANELIKDVLVREHMFAEFIEMSVIGPFEVDGGEIAQRFTVREEKS